MSDPGNSETRDPVWARLVDTAADAAAAKHRPPRETWQRRQGQPPDGIPRLEWGDWVMTESGTADDQTMTTFRAEDGHLSIRGLTWREATEAVAAQLVPLLADEIDAIDPVAAALAGQRAYTYVAALLRGLTGGNE